MSSPLLRRLALAFIAAAVPGLASAQYQLVWEDQFNGNTLDLTKWEPMVGNGCPNLCGWGNNELQYYRAENATVSNGTLKITARQQNFGGAQYTSARLRTANKADFTYGRFEMRAKMPAGQGLWPAFWMLPTDYVFGGWAASGEIDVMEYLGNDTRTVYGTIHYGGEYPANAYSGGARTVPFGNLVDDFHEYAVEWDETEMRWYLDGQLYSTKTSWWSSGGAYPAPFNQRFHMLLNLAVGGNWPGAPNGSTQFPATMEVDYVRVFQEGVSNPNACAQVFDDMELADPASDYFTFGGPSAGGQVSNEVGDHPPVAGSQSLDANWGNLFNTPGFLGGFGRTFPLDLSNATHFDFWIKPKSSLDLVIEINLQDDDNGDNVIPSVPDGADDEFQYELHIAATGTEIVSGAGWQKVSIPLSEFTDDNSYHTGGNGIWDPTPTGAGGNGQMVNVVFALVSLNGLPAEFKVDQWEFTRKGAIAGRVWADENEDGIDNLEYGLEGVSLRLVDDQSGSVVGVATTDADGRYEFSALAGGDFAVEVLPSGLPFGATPTFDPDGVNTPGAFAVTLSCGEELTDQNFGYKPYFLGQTYCSPASPNSTGGPGEISASGSVVTAQNDVVLFCSSLPSNQFGYFLTSMTPGFLPNPAGSQGNLCVLGDIGRYIGPGQVQNSGLLGLVSLTINLDQMPRPTGPMAVQPGDTWFFQFWHRDGSSSGPVSNMTDALRIQFQ